MKTISLAELGVVTGGFGLTYQVPGTNITRTPQSLEYTVPGTTIRRNDAGLSYRVPGTNITRTPSGLSYTIPGTTIQRNGDGTLTSRVPGMNIRITR